MSLVDEVGTQWVEHGAVAEVGHPLRRGLGADRSGGLRGVVDDDASGTWAAAVVAKTDVAGSPKIPSRSLP
jgi:hypothetical protein